MRRLSLGTLLTGVNVGLVALAVVCVVAAATSLLRRLTDEQALARAGLASSAAARAIENTGRDLLAAAHRLAEQPALAPLVEGGAAPALQDLLARFRLAHRLSGCAVLRGGRPLARDGGALRWPEIPPSPGDADDRLVLLAGPDGAPVLAALAAVPSVEGTLAAVATPLDDAFARAIGRQVGLPVVILDREQALSDVPQAGIRTRALDSEEPVAARIDDVGTYVAVVPLHAPGGQVIGLVETVLPPDGLASSYRRFARSLLLIALVIGGLAVFFSVLVGRWLVRPLEALTIASARIGMGDLTTPILRTAGAEIGTLAATMEDMRGRLLHLTAALRQRQGEAEAVLTGIAEGVFSVDRQRRIRYLNPQASALLGIRPEEAIGRFCGDVLNPQSPGGVRPCEDRCPIVHARFRGSARATEDLLLASGERRSVVITSAPAEAGMDGESAGPGAPFGGARQFQVLRDETEVEATRRLRDNVLANITHEFRTPLTAQLASLELLRDRLPDLKTEEVRHLISSLERGALRLTQLIDNLLESVRIDAGHDSIRRRPVAIEETVDEAVELASPLLALREQTLTVDLPYPMPAVIGDGPRLVQVFVNLLANANKFAPAGSTVRIGGEVRGAEIALWVEDEGPGLPADADDRLFERFIRSPGEEPEESGMGLGLFIVKSIVERHGGRVEALRAGSAAASVEEGGDEGAAETRPGTRMCVILPAGGQA